MTTLVRDAPAGSEIPTPPTVVGVPAVLIGIAACSGFIGNTKTARLLAAAAVIGLAWLLLAFALRAYWRWRGAAFMPTGERRRQRDAWAMAQPLWRLITLAVLPPAVGCAVCLAEIVAGRPFWLVPWADWQAGIGGGIGAAIGSSLIWLMHRHHGRHRGAET